MPGIILASVMHDNYTSSINAGQLFPIPVIVYTFLKCEEDKRTAGKGQEYNRQAEDLDQAAG